MVCMILDISQGQTVILKRWETNEVNLTGSPAFVLREFPRHGVGRGAQVESRETKEVRVHRTRSQRRESHMETELWRSAEQTSTTQQMSDEYLPVQKLPETGKGIT